jgi:N6-adenosine-specific RNA methylase IME4/ParB-like chromosome segregation protein Spo0J
MTARATSRRIADIRIGKRHRRDMGDISAFASNIAVVGLLHPIVIRPDGKLIAGERRILAAKQLGWETIPVTVVDLEKVALGEFAENAVRKDFTLSEAVAIKRALEPVERAAAKERMTAGKPLEKFSKGRALDKVATVTGKHRTTIAKAEAVVDAAEAEPEKFSKLKEDMDRTGRVNGPYRRLKNAQQAEAIRAAPPPLPGGPHYVGVADNPWAYEPDDDDAPHRGALPYPTLSIEQLCALGVGAIFHANAVLWLWVTNFILARGLHLPVLAAWGFESKTVLTWPKDRKGRGHWLNGQTEHVVMAVRGEPIITLSDQTTLLRPPFHLVQTNVHSAKPREFYDFVERLCPAPRYVDLFSRYQHNEKWVCHGDQAPVTTESTSDDLSIPAVLRRGAP